MRASNSNHGTDEFTIRYDMYGDDRSISGWEPGARSNSRMSDVPTHATEGERVGVEVVEMANGESIWYVYFQPQDYWFDFP